MSLKDADFQTVLEKVLLLDSYKRLMNNSNFHLLPGFQLSMDTTGDTLTGVRLTLFKQTSKQLVFHVALDRFGNWFPVVFHRGIWLSKIEQAIAEHEQQHMSEIDDSAYFS